MSQDRRSSENPPSQGSAGGVRFTLKKRSIRNPDNLVNLSSYNSDFLNGLFADVAKVSVEPNAPGTKRCSDIISADHSISADEMHTSVPTKKSRTSLRKCLSKVQRSAMNLSSLGEIVSPKGINELFRDRDESRAKDIPKSPKLNHQDSLQFQLNCVSERSESCEDCPNRTVEAENAAIIAFPNLPATVSDSSCYAGLTRANLVRQASIPENSRKESFGWFVDLDDNQTVEVNPSLPYAVSSDSLAFQAPTAPKRINDDAELEWAQAADTIDDVLGDFF